MSDSLLVTVRSAGAFVGAPNVVASRVAGVVEFTDASTPRRPGRIQPQGADIGSRGKEEGFLPSADDLPPMDVVTTR